MVGLYVKAAFARGRLQHYDEATSLSAEIDFVAYPKVVKHPSTHARPTGLGKGPTQVGIFRLVTSNGCFQKNNRVIDISFTTFGKIAILITLAIIPTTN